MEMLLFSLVCQTRFYFTIPAITYWDSLQFKVLEFSLNILIILIIASLSWLKPKIKNNSSNRKERETRPFYHYLII